MDQWICDNLDMSCLCLFQFLVYVFVWVSFFCLYLYLFICMCRVFVLSISFASVFLCHFVSSFFSNVLCLSHAWWFFFCFLEGPSFSFFSLSSLHPETRRHDKTKGKTRRQGKARARHDTTRHDSTPTPTPALSPPQGNTTAQHNTKRICVWCCCGCVVLWCGCSVVFWCGL